MGGNALVIVVEVRGKWADILTERAEKHLRTSKLEVDGLQQRKITFGATPVRQEQEFEAIMGTDSPNC